MKGYMGQILRVNLTAHSVAIEPLDEDLVRSYIGGTGIASKIFCTEVDPQVDPLGSENKLVFAVGPLTATLTPMSGRHVVIAKSPLTGLWGEGDAGGFWGHELKRAGFDVVIVEGISERPVYLWISDNAAEIKPAEELWGLDSIATDVALKSTLGKRVKVAAIGQGGENLVKFAAIMNDGGRAVGRGGLGAVMGSKKLKAIAVRGTQRVDVAHPDMLGSLRKEILADLRDSVGAQSLAKSGTGGNLDFMLMSGNLPLKNWAGDEWEIESVRAISAGRVSKDSFRKTKAGCYGCPVGCEKVVRVSSGPYAVEEGSGPEYETVAALGSLLLNDSWESIVKANDLCNRYGIDTIEAGTTIAMAMECFEKGILTEEEVGMPLQWGDPGSIVKAVQMIGERKGFGDVLAEGVRGAAESIGGGASEFAMHVKGSSLCMHDPRFNHEMGLKYSTLSMGAYHGKGSISPIEGIMKTEVAQFAERVIAGQNFAEVVDSLIVCSFSIAQWAGAISLEYVPKLLLAVTGREWAASELDILGERIFNMKRVFITKLGVTRQDDRLPKRFIEIPRVRGDQQMTAEMVITALDEYYRLRGWADDGRPTTERLAKLGIGSPA
ncbi:MAG: aldehyde ferredoxin oxidoreductase family protein [Chloroflexota bacterium]